VELRLVGEAREGLVERGEEILVASALGEELDQRNHGVG
jgi:hypothetical protein